MMLPDKPPGEDGFQRTVKAAETAGLPQEEGTATETEMLAADLLRLVGQAESQFSSSTVNNNRRGWDRAYKAFHNEFFTGSKYLSDEYKHRSKLFRPKTRSAVRKDNASIAASLFSTINAISCTAGNEGDEMQRASAAVIQELVNYRTDRTSGRNSIPWFKVAMGARQDALMTGVCLSKQYWKLDTRVVGTEQVSTTDPWTGETTVTEREVVKVLYDRPDSKVIPPENYIIDPAADWTDPAQTSAYLIIKWPMRIDEIRQMEKHRTDPWKHLEDSVLLSSNNMSQTQSAAIRTARERGNDRFDKSQTGSGSQNDWDVIWVYETYIRVDGEDLTFFSIRDKAMLTDPRPVDEVYPWNQGDRPLALGYGSLESHRIFPMSPAESWQPLQQEMNDLASLRLDTVKQNVSPITKVKAGRGVDLKAIQRRGANTMLLLQDPENDVIWDRPPELPQSAYAEMERLNVDFDDLAGQFNSGSVQTNRSLNETVGGLKLIAGSANAVQEFDQRVWIETWAEPAIAQIVRLEQYYEDDKTVLALCGDRAKIRQKYGMNDVTDEMLDQQITVRIDVGLGVGDPAQRMAKLTNALAVIEKVVPLIPEFKTGEWKMNGEEMFREIFGSAGYRDGGMRFITKSPPKQGPDPGEQLQIESAKAEIAEKLASADEKHAKAAKWVFNKDAKAFEAEVA